MLWDLLHAKLMCQFFVIQSFTCKIESLAATLAESLDNLLACVAALFLTSVCQFLSLRGLLDIA